MEYKTREEVPEKYKWDLTKRYENFSEWKKDYDIIKQNIMEFKKYDGHMFDNPEKLYECLEFKSNLSKKVISNYCYTMLVLDEMLEKDESISNYKLAERMFSLYQTTVSFFEPEILKNSSKVEEYVKIYSPLEKYNKYLKDILREKEHILTSDEEKILGKLSSIMNTFDNTSSTLLNSEINYGEVIDDKGNKVTITSNNTNKLLKSHNRALRKEVSEKVGAARFQFKTTFANQLASSMQYEHQLATIRKFKNVMDMVFFSEDIDTEVNDKLYSVVEKRLSSFQNYLNTLRKNINVEKLETYDLRVNPFESDKKYTIEEMQAIILDSLSILGDDYVKILKQAFEDKWIDYCGYKGKTSVTYCLSTYGDTPNIIAHLHGSMEDVSTLAHELGHAINSYYMYQNNYFHEADHTNILAEITSLTNEILLTNYIINNSKDENEKKSYIFRMIDTIQNNLFDACLEGKLENIVYEKLEKGEVVSANDFTEITNSLKKQYYGDTVSLNEYSGLSWISRSHYFTPFYLYQYAVSVCCACYVGNKIISNEDNMKEKYLKFLTLGDQMNTVDTVKTLGIDLLSEDVYKEAILYFDKLVDLLNK